MYNTIKSISVPNLYNFKAIPLFNKILVTVPGHFPGARLVCAQPEHYAPKGVLYIITDAASVNWK